MKKSNSITALFLDIGGVLLTDGWSHGASKLAAKKFNLDLEELNKRHTEASTPTNWESSHLKNF
jgi:putative hydrolase of the HAD superfamily